MRLLRKLKHFTTGAVNHVEVTEMTTYTTRQGQMNPSTVGRERNGTCHLPGRLLGLQQRCNGGHIMWGRTYRKDSSDWGVQDEVWESSWLQIKRSELDSLCYQIFREIVGLEWGPLSLVSTTEELLERNSGLEIREYGRRDPSR
jgi:hypothetical protein